MRREIQLVKNETDKPYGVDILFAEVRGEDATTNGYTSEVEEHIEVTFEEGASVIVSGLGNPARIIPRAHAAGMKVMSLVGTSRQACKVEASGVDAVIASGNEGGGHVGRVGTLPLVAKVVDSVGIPVLAAGGISDGRGLVAALALGAQGVWLGTRFIATEEARGHINYKQKIVDIDEDGTTVTRGHSGKTARIIRNNFSDYWASHEADIKPFPYQLREVGEPASIRGRALSAVGLKHHDGLFEKMRADPVAQTGLVEFDRADLLTGLVEHRQLDHDPPPLVLAFRTTT